MAKKPVTKIDASNILLSYYFFTVCNSVFSAYRSDSFFAQRFCKQKNIFFLSSFFGKPLMDREQFFSFSEKNKLATCYPPSSLHHTAKERREYYFLHSPGLPWRRTEREKRKAARINWQGEKGEKGKKLSVRPSSLRGPIKRPPLLFFFFFS